MPFPLPLLPKSLAGRIFALYAANMLLVVGAALFLFYAQQFNEQITSAQDKVAVLGEVVAQTVSDSAVIGDYDAIKRTLQKAVRDSTLSSASYIDIAGGTLTVTASARPEGSAPRWLEARVGAQLPDVNSVIRVGGRDYGIVRLRFAPDAIADDIWSVTVRALVISTTVLLIGLILIRLALRHWLGGLDSIRQFDWTEAARAAGEEQALEASAPVEIREAVASFRKAGAALQTQRETAAVTLAAIADGVITTDAQGRILYANPAAERVLKTDVTSLLRRNLRDALPAAFAHGGADDPATTAPERRIELRPDPDGAIVLDTTFAPILDASGGTIGHVLAWHDVTAAQSYENRLRSELETRQAALQSLRDALKGMLPEASLGNFAVSDDDLGAVAQLVAKLVQQREADRRTLDNQMRALDEHAGVTIHDADHNVIYANRKFSEITGYAIEEIMQHGGRPRSTADALPTSEHYREMLDTVSTGRVWHGEIVDRHKDGSPYWVTTTVVPCFDDSGGPAQFISIRTDITPQRKAERELAESRQRELATGHAIQRSLLIGELPGGVRVADAASYSEPSEGIDGDFFTFTTYRSNCIEVLVGDVMGKGIPAALIGAAVRTSYNEVVAELLARSFGSGELPSPADILNGLHRKLTPRLIDLESFVTMALYRFDFDFGSGAIRYVNAGHTPGLLVRARGGVETLLGPNLPIGVLPGEHYVEISRPVGPGDALLVYSDGITEARDPTGEDFGEWRLREFVDAYAGSGLPTGIFLQLLRRTVREFCGARGLSDDQTAVMVALNAPGDTDTPTPEVLDLPWDAARLEPLRRRVAAVAAPLGAEMVDRLVLAAFEAATNVTRHVAAPFPDATMSCRIARRGYTVVVELWYLGEPFQPPEDLQPDFTGASDGGFGLYIMSQAATSVTHESPLPGVCCTRLTQVAGVPTRY